MKQLVIALLIMLTFSNSALAITDMFIGIFADNTYSTCYDDISAFAPETIYFAAYVCENIPYITAAEFSVDNWQGTVAGRSLVTMAWNTDLVFGTVDDGISLAFSTPIPGPCAPLGSATVLSLDFAWLADETLMTVVAANDSGLLQVIDGDFTPHVVHGGIFTYNCVNPLDCICNNSCSCENLCMTASDVTSWSSLKALY
ncbi:MAG: hypothetical protein GY835_07030 [bacterium]|nr:hypothetical protein [bacterium]